MALSLGDWLKLWLLPSQIYYRRKLRSETQKGEPEIAILPQLLPDRSGTAIDVGANRGIYSYLLSGLCDRVVAFEPNPDLARFSRRMLPRNVEVVQIALGAEDTTGELQIPVGKSGREDHLKASLSALEPASLARAVGVNVRSLDGLGFDRVCFIKIDVEGTELEVIEGARRTIARDRPLLMVEVLAGYYDSPDNTIRRICSEYDYSAKLVTQHGLVEAADRLNANVPLLSRNVLFFPNDQ